MGRGGLFAAGIPGEVRFIYLPRRGVYNWSGPLVKNLERDVPYSAFYFNPTNGKRYNLGTVVSAGPPAKPFEGHAQPRLFEDRFEGASPRPGRTTARRLERKDGRLVGGKGMVTVLEKVSDADLMASADANSDAEAGIILRFHDADNYLVGALQPVAEGHLHSRPQEWSMGCEPRQRCPCRRSGRRSILPRRSAEHSRPLVLTDGKKTYYTPIVEVANTTAGKTGLWLYQIGDRQEFRRFELSRAQFVRMKRQAEPSAKHDAKTVLLHSDEWRTPNVPSPQDWVLVMEQVKS